jgi:hypothetical protein
MKKYSWLLLLAFMAYACQLQNEEVSLSTDASGSHDNSHYTVIGSSTNGKTFTFNISLNEDAKDISHIIFLFKDCDSENYLDLSNVTSFKVNGVEWLGDPDHVDDIVAGTGQGESCYAEVEEHLGNVIKLDAGFDDDLEVIITLDTKSSGGDVYIKTGSGQCGCSGCFGPYAFEYDCEEQPCYEYKEETAWANGPRYVTRGNWATYVPYAEGTVNVYAGQHHLAGTASFSGVVDGKVTITIELADGWSLQEGGSTVKIQDYPVAPSGNPSPGRFAHKGTSLTIEVPANNYYGIHLDVQKQVEVECPDE